MMEIPDTLLREHISRGDILWSYFKGINHPKFFVVMGISEDKVCGYFFINSNISDYIYNKQELLDLQYIIKHKEYDFLNYDSFVCASDVKEISLDTIAQGIKNNRIEVKGRLKTEHINDIINMVNQSKAVKPIHKKLYFSDNGR